ncbi:MAG: M48 family metalloprotease [bacterium]
MIKLIIKIIIIILVYFGLTNWVQIKFLLGNLFRPKSKGRIVDYKKMTDLVKQKTGLNITIKELSEQRHMIGFMLTQRPLKPVMVFSQKMLSSFNFDELEWVVLHESAHYMKFHNYKLIATNIFCFLIAYLLIMLLNLPFLVALIVIVIFSIVYIQCAKIFEYEADRYAIGNVNNPEGVITGNLKMKDSKISKNILFSKLFVIAVPSDKRIQMAKEEIKKRTLKN